MSEDATEAGMVAVYTAMKIEIAELKQNLEDAQADVARLERGWKQDMADRDQLLKDNAKLTAELAEARADRDFERAQCASLARLLDEYIAEVRRLRELQREEIASAVKAAAEAGQWRTRAEAAEADNATLRALVQELCDALDAYWKNRTAPIGGHPMPGDLIARARAALESGDGS